MMEKPSKFIGTIFAAAVLCLFTTTVAAESSRSLTDERECLAINTTHISHDVAIRRLMNVAEVQRWEGQITKNKRQISTIPNTNHTVYHNGQCFWEINLYEVNDDQFLRWNAYQISLTKPLVYRVDVVNPDQLIPVNFFLIENLGVANE
jgi:hypothetical protein